MYFLIISLLLPDCTHVTQTTTRFLLQIDWLLFNKQLWCSNDHKTPWQHFVYLLDILKCYTIRISSVLLPLVDCSKIAYKSLHYKLLVR